MIGNDELESEDVPWAMLEETPVPLVPGGDSSLIAVPVPPFKRAAPLSVLQDAREGCGGHLWQAALELCTHMDTHPAWAERDLCGLRCLELGAGTGLAGMYAARRGARVLCTDLAVMLPVLKRNVELNFSSSSSSSSAAAATTTTNSPLISVAEYCWGTDPRVLGDAPFDLILASDCVYLEAAFEPLLKSLEALVVPGRTTLLLSYQHRRKAESYFFRRLWKLFTLIPSQSRHGPRTTSGGGGGQDEVGASNEDRGKRKSTSDQTIEESPIISTSTTPAMGKSHKVQILALVRQVASVDGKEDSL